MKKIEIHLASYPSIGDPRHLPVAPLFLVHSFPKFQFMLDINLTRFDNLEQS